MSTNIDHLPHDNSSDDHNSKDRHGEESTKSIHDGQTQILPTDDPVLNETSDNLSETRSLSAWQNLRRRFTDGTWKQTVHLRTTRRKILAATAAGIIVLGGGAVTLHEVIEHSVRHALHAEFRHEHGDHHHGKGHDRHRHKHDEQRTEERTQSNPRTSIPTTTPAPGQQTPSGDRAQSHADETQSATDQAQSTQKPALTNQSGTSDQPRANN